jgi:predicted DNA-binding transcriptional regulator AlpA
LTPSTFLEITLMLDDDDDDRSPFLTIDEAAKLLRINRRTLDNLRWNGKGPPARRHGGRIVYHRKSVLDWSERRCTRTPASHGTSKAPPCARGNGGTEHTGDDRPATWPPASSLERDP